VVYYFASYSLEEEIPKDVYYDIVKEIVETRGSLCMIGIRKKYLRLFVLPIYVDTYTYLADRIEKLQAPDSVYFVIHKFLTNSGPQYEAAAAIFKTAIMKIVDRPKTAIDLDFKWPVIVEAIQDWMDYIGPERFIKVIQSNVSFRRYNIPARILKHLLSQRNSMSDETIKRLIACSCFNFYVWEKMDGRIDYIIDPLVDHYKRDDSGIVISLILSIYEKTL
jgi:hypothetical protein